MSYTILNRITLSTLVHASAFYKAKPNSAVMWRALQGEHNTNGGKQ